METAELHAPEGDETARLSAALSDMAAVAADDGSWEELCARPCNARVPAEARAAIVEDALLALRRLCVRQVSHPQARSDETSAFTATFTGLLELSAPVARGARGVAADRFYMDTLADCFAAAPGLTLLGTFAVLRRMRSRSKARSDEQWHDDKAWLSSEVFVPFVAILCTASCLRGRMPQEDGELEDGASVHAHQDSVLSRCEGACASLLGSMDGELKRAFRGSYGRLESGTPRRPLPPPGAPRRAGL